MSDQSAIEWTDSTWNVVTGCTRVSPGCANCYIERTPPFRMAGRKFDVAERGLSTTGLVFHPERLERVPKGPRVFVNSLSDLFHEEIPREFVHSALDAMRLRPDRTFQVLTKRPEQAKAVVESYYALTTSHNPLGGRVEYPLPNVWLGVSIENARYTWRADVLREIPASVRFISAEPLLGSLFSKPTAVANVRTRGLDLTGIDWVIVGGESGPHARPMHPDWAREIRDACMTCSECGHSNQRHAYIVKNGKLESAPCNGGCSCAMYGPTSAFFFKQWGQYAPVIGHLDGLTNLYTLIDDHLEPWHGYIHGASTVWDRQATDGRGHPIFQKLGKKAAGREFDGRTWDEMPVTLSALVPGEQKEGPVICAEP